jgi:hypothetical protein
LLRKDFISNDQEEENTNYFVLIFALLLALVPVSAQLLQLFRSASSRLAISEQWDSASA